MDASQGVGEAGGGRTAVHSLATKLRGQKSSDKAKGFTQASEGAPPTTGEIFCTLGGACDWNEGAMQPSLLPVIASHISHRAVPGKCRDAFWPWFWAAWGL